MQRYWVLRHPLVPLDHPAKRPGWTVIRRGCGSGGGDCGGGTGQWGKSSWGVSFESRLEAGRGGGWCPLLRLRSSRVSSEDGAQVDEKSW
jgi:hypothetical protein